MTAVWRGFAATPVLVSLTAMSLAAQQEVPLTNLPVAAPGVGLPDDWTLRQTRAAPAPLFAVTAEHALRVEARASAGFALFELAHRLPEAPGVLRWRWRTSTPIPAADLRRQPADDSPARAVVAFADRRTLFYSWGNRDTIGTAFPSWTGRSRIVIVLREATEADGAWRLECRDPFGDYRRAFTREPPPIVAVGMSADTEQLGAATWAEIADLSWWPAPSDRDSADQDRPPLCSQ
ncbi:MAG: DUF3047 domain-containing protein [Gemmatimonadota bacterium]|nr:DUF3047 domain-containing protein [Gemmatimonadota bacterium]